MNEYGEIMFPGDSGADPANVYNCRCTLLSVFDGFDFEESDRQAVERYREQRAKETPYEKWKESKR